MEAASINLFLVPLDRSLIFLSAGTFNRDRYSQYFIHIFTGKAEMKAAFIVIKAYFLFYLPAVVRYIFSNFISKFISDSLKSR